VEFYTLLYNKTSITLDADPQPYHRGDSSGIRLRLTTKKGMWRKCEMNTITTSSLSHEEAMNVRLNTSPPMEPNAWGAV
jgi:hypothetical protein